ncbi:MAG TPA: SAM-dependent methyltransferase, partial [Rhodoferax sp.]|nr:SAM-dependent methyltransferase [Rhodoferax sp.]
LRVLARRSDGQAGLAAEPMNPRVAAMLSREDNVGMRSAAFYSDLQRQAIRIKRELLLFLLKAQASGETVAAYGAAAKGNTLLNFAGVRADLVPYVVDRNPAKQGKFLPGSRIPVRAPEYLLAHRPEYVLILPWNLKKEVMEEVGAAVDWAGRFVVAVPTLQIV